MKKLINLLFAIAFCLMLILPLVYTNTEKNVVSDIDNRNLVEMPELFCEGFTEKLEDYIKDRIGGRDQMINAYDIINDCAFNELTHPTYTYGKDGYIFFNMHNNIEFGEYHKTFAKMVSEINDYCESRGSDFYLIFDPEKISVYRQYLPEGVNYNDDWVDELMKCFDEYGIKYVNNTDLLIEKSKEVDVFNKKYDAGHWNDYGAFYASNALLELIHEDYPEVVPMTEDLFDIDYEIKPYLPNSRFTVNESVPVFTLKTDYDVVQSAWSSQLEVNYNYNHFHYYINRSSGAELLPKALVFQGSYYNRNSQYFISPFSEYIGVHNYQNVINFDYYYNIFQPDIVILDVAEYVLSNTYFDSSAMQAMDLNPALSEDEINTAISPNSAEKADVYVNRAEKIDTVMVDIEGSPKYAYLVAGDTVIDLKQDETSFYTAYCASGLISNNKDKLAVVLENSDGSRAYMSAEIL